MTAPDGDISVGSVSVEVVASARNFARSLRNEVDKSFKTLGQNLKRTINRELGARDVKKRPQIRVRIDQEQVAREARRAITTVRRVFKERGPVTLRVQIPEAQAAREANAAVRAARRAGGTLPIRPTVSRSDAVRQARAARRAAQAAMRRVQLRVELENRSVTTAVRTLGQVLGVATAAAGGLAAIGAIGQGASAALAGIAAAAGGLIPILGQLVSVAVTAAGALAAIPGALAIAGAGIGALVIGSSGLGGALKEAGQAAGGAGGAAADMGRQTERAARQVTLARRGIADAARGVMLAERSLADAQREARRAQRDLNEARREARENLEDLALSLARARLDEESAVFAVTDAERELAAVRADPRSTVEDIERADLAYRESVQSLAEVRDQLEDVSEEQAEAAALGVENSDAVVAAREREVDAARGVEQAQYDLRRSERDLADAHYALAEAQKDLAQAQQAGAASGGGVASAMSKLAPAAQELVRTLLALKPAWDALRLDVQQALWVGVADEVRNLADRQLPILRAGLVQVAGVLNGAMRDGLRQLASESSRIRLAQILGASARAFEGLAVAVQPAIRALLDLTAVGADVVADLAGPAGEALVRFADRISEMAASGELRQLILDGLDALKLLGSALLDIGGIIQGVFRAAGEAGGGGIFGFLDRLNELVNSVQGQDALTTLFSELSRIGDALMPVLLELGRGLGVVAGAIGDIAVETAPFLADALGPLAQALASLAPGFIALAPSTVALAEALVPLGEILSDLVVGIAPGVEVFLLALGDGLALLAPAAKPVGEALGRVLEALAPLLPLIGASLANSLITFATLLTAILEVATPFIDVFSRIGEEFAARFAPIIQELAERLLPVFADAGIKILEALAPLVPVMADLAEQMAGSLADALPDLVDAFVLLFEAITDHETGLLKTLVDLLIDLAPQMPALVDAWLDLAVALSDLLVSLVPLIPFFTRLITGVLRIATPAVVGTMAVLVGLLAGMIRNVSGVVRAVAGFVTGFGDRLSGALDTAREFFGTLFNWFRRLPGRIGRFLSKLPKRVAYWISFALGRAHKLANDGIKAIVEFFKKLPGRASNAVRNLWRRIRGAFETLVREGPRRARQMADRFVSFVRKLPGRARDQAVKVKDRVIGAFRGAKNWLREAGRDLIRGLADGALGLRDWVVDQITGIGRSIIDGIKDGLGISSPSTVFRDEVGRWIPAGIAEGVRRNAGVAVDATDDLIGRFQHRFDPMGSFGRLDSAAPDAPVTPVVIDGRGLDRALAQWLRGAVRTQGRGNVQQFAGSRT